MKNLIVFKICIEINTLSLSIIIMINEDYLNGFLRYSRMVENAFDFYKNKLHSQIKLEQQNNNNPVVIAQTNLILHSLDMNKKNVLNNIGILFDKSENHGNPSIFEYCIFEECP